MSWVEVRVRWSGWWLVQDFGASVLFQRVRVSAHGREGEQNEKPRNTQDKELRCPQEWGNRMDNNPSAPEWSFGQHRACLSCYRGRRCAHTRVQISGTDTRHGRDHRGGRLGRWGRPNPPRGKSSLKYRATDATAGLYQGSVHTGPGTGIRPPTLEWGKGKVWEGKCKVAQELEGPYARQAAAQLWVNHLRHPRQKLLGLLLWCSRTGLLLRRLGARGQGAHGWGTR